MTEDRQKMKMKQNGGIWFWDPDSFFPEFGSGHEKFMDTDQDPVTFRPDLNNTNIVHKKIMACCSH